MTRKINWGRWLNAKSTQKQPMKLKNKWQLLGKISILKIFDHMISHFHRKQKKVPNILVLVCTRGRGCIYCTWGVVDFCDSRDNQCPYSAVPCQCTMWLSTLVEISKICKSKGLVLAQFWSKSDNLSSDWWKKRYKIWNLKFVNICHFFSHHLKVFDVPLFGWCSTRP